MDWTSRHQELVVRQRQEISEGLFSAVRRLHWSAEQLAEERQRRLRHLLEWSVARSAFWRERLADVDVHTFTEADLPSLPPLRKADLMNDFDRALTRPGLSLERLSTHFESSAPSSYLDDEYRVMATSGSGGTRVMFAFNSDEWVTFALLATRWRGREGAVANGGPVASLFSASPKHVSGALHALFADDPDASSLTQLPSTMPLPEIVAGLNRVQPEVLQGYPTVVYLLALEALAGRLWIAPKHIRTCGEQCSERTRSTVRSAWGIEIYDYWGTTEGVYAFPCRIGEGMHVPDDLAIIEAVDTEGRPVPPGELGAKILLTNLYNFTQPLIRYEISDRMTVLAQACACGCAHRRIANIRGRGEDYFMYPNGTAAHGSGLTSAVIADPYVAEMQFTQTPGGMVVSVVGRGACDLGAMQTRLELLLRESGLPEPEVEMRQVESLERLWSGKVRLFEPLNT